MRLDPLLDPFYILGSLWGAFSGTPIAPRCVDSASPFPRAAYATGWIAPSRPAPPGVTAFVHVNVIPMDTERVLHDQTVVVAGGRITARPP